MAEIFLSYGHDDLATAKRYAQAFQRAGFSVWWDESLRSGEAFDTAIERAIEDAKAVVVLWSRSSVQSRWVRAEATLAEKSGTLVSVLIESCKLPIMFQLTHTVDLSQWRGSMQDPAWLSVLAGVRRQIQSGPPDKAAVPPADPPVARPGRRVLLLSTLALLVGMGLVLGTRWLSRPSAPSLASGDSASPETSDRVGVATSAAPSAEGASIAVLPFADMSPGHDQDYFSDGLSEELLNQLAHLPDLRVIGRTSSFSFKGKNEDLRKIGQVLGVNHILEGSVRKSGDRVRVTAQLINPEDGSHLWSETYDRTVQDVFGIQEEIARTVANALQLTLDTKKVGENGTKNVEAFDEFLAGRAEAIQTSAKSLQAAASHFERAVELDPKYEMAWANLVETYQGVIINVPSVRAQSERKLDAAVDRVTALQPGSALASYALYFRNSSTTNLVERRRLLQSATNAPPPLGASAQLNYGLHLMSVGSNRKALAQLLVSRQTDPLAFFPALVLEISLEIAEDFDRADADRKRVAQTIGGDNAVLLGTALVRAMARGDVSLVRQAAKDVAAADDVRQPINAAMLDSLADGREAVKRLRRLLDEPKYRGDLYALAAIAQWAAYFGDPRLSLQALNAAPRNQPPVDSWSFTFWRPVMRDVRRLPEFKRLLKDRGFVDLWRATGDWGDFCKPVGKDDFECH